MPELPEVETVVRGLSSLVKGKEITTVTCDWQKSLRISQNDIDAFIIGAKITNVHRRAKLIIIDLNTKYSLLVHLKMTGQMVYVANDKRFGAGHPNDSLIHSLPDKSTRVIFTFKDDTTLYYNDQRKFGWIKSWPTSELLKEDFIAKLGPEPLEADFTDEVFIDRMRRRDNSNIKAVLLDQSVLAGVGNIYADEALFMAKIRPERKVCSVPGTQLKELRKAIIDVLNVSISKGGSSNKNYVNADGRKGSYSHFAQVFRREGKPCLVCSSEIIKTKVAGRGTHICEQCQS